MTGLNGTTRTTTWVRSGGNIREEGASSAPETEKPQEPPATPQATEPAKEVEEKVDIEAYRSKKDQMMVELDGLLEKQREADQQKGQ